MRINNHAQRIIPPKYLVLDSSLIYLFSARPRLFWSSRVFLSYKAVTSYWNNNLVVKTNVTRDDTGVRNGE